MATKKKPPPKSAGPKNPNRRPAKELVQPALPGADTPINQRVQDAALVLIDRTADRRDALRACKEQADRLIGIMTEEGVREYHHDKLHVRLKDDVKVKTKVDKDKKPRKKKVAGRV